MVDASPRLEGKEWQRWATKLLHCRYAVGEYQEVPDKRAGDAGVEGYSLDGRAYQMYGPEGPLTFAQRHENIRKKLSAEIKKFIENTEKLSRVFGTLKIKRWVLLVPSFESRELVEHAARKTAEVIAARLPYVDASDFRVMVVPEDAFGLERDKLLAHSVSTIEVQSAAVSDDEIAAWTELGDNSALVDRLDEKLGRLPTLNGAARRLRFRRDIVGYLLHGQNVLEALRVYPDIWAAIRRVKSEQEKYLFTRCMSSGKAPGGILEEALDRIRREVEDKAAALSSGDKEAIAHEAMADWLVRCPLDFPETERHEQ